MRLIKEIITKVEESRKGKMEVTFHPKILSQAVNKIANRAREEGRRRGEIELLEGVRAASRSGSLERILEGKPRR